uniref:Uncharacterized protein n=1 Tax=Rhizophora mucronata TaxID=61149 RepID=A0A2P2MX80_RHIMU
MDVIEVLGMVIDSQLVTCKLFVFLIFFFPSFQERGKTIERSIACSYFLGAIWILSNLLYFKGKNKNGNVIS